MCQVKEKMIEVGKASTGLKVFM
jgi:hypothetical protein